MLFKNKKTRFSSTCKHYEKQHIINMLSEIEKTLLSGPVVLLTPFASPSRIYVLRLQSIRLNARAQPRAVDAARAGGGGASATVDAGQRSGRPPSLVGSDAARRDGGARPAATWFHIRAPSPAPPRLSTPRPRRYRAVNSRLKTKPQRRARRQQVVVAPLAW